MEEPRTYESPRALRAALDAAQGDWTAILSPAQLDHPLPPQHWGGHTTLRSWLADGATRHNATQVWPLVAPAARR
jgi:hypothetical protein